MSKVSEMSLKSIIKQTDIEFDFQDINKFCSNPKVAKELQKRLNNSIEFQEYLIESEEYIDKEKLILISWLNYKEDFKKKLSNNIVCEDDYRNVEENIRVIKKILNETERKIIKISNNKIISENARQRELGGLLYDKNGLNQLKKILESMLKIKNISNDMNTYLIKLSSENGRLNKINVISSQEEILGVSYEDKQKENKKICDEIDKKLSEKDEEKIGLIYALQFVNVDDLYCVLPESIANVAIYKIESNTERIYKKEVEKIQENAERDEIDDETIELNTMIRENATIPQMRECIEDLLKYIDLEKLLLIAIYRFESAVESEYIDNNNRIPPGELKYIKKLSIQLLSYIKGETSVESENINYTYQEAKKFIKRICIHNVNEENKNEVIYVTKKNIEDLKEDLLHGENIARLPEEDILILNLMEFTQDELEKVMQTSKENLAFGIAILNPNEDEIIEYSRVFKKNWSNELTEYLVKKNKLSNQSLLNFYYAGLVNAEFFKEFLEELDTSSEINLQTINQLYKQVKNSKEPNKEARSKLNKQIELYKLFELEGKTQQEIEEASENVIYEIGEDFDKENKDITFYFENGLLTLNTVAEWTNDTFIEKLYNDSKVTLQDIEDLYSNGKITQKLIEKAVLENQELEYSELIAYIYLGYISESKIEELYMSGKIFDSTLEEIALQGKISLQKYLEITTKRTKEVLEENSKIKLELINIPTKKEINGITINEDDDTIKDTSYNISVRKNKTLIDPSARYKFLELLGAKEATAIIPDEDNAFYNYEFFVIPDANGELQANSVVIAERIWENKEDQSQGLATENATYFFQYKDLMVNSNLSKKEMSQERDKIISTANHRIGSWAVSVLYRIAQTTKSSDLKEYKKGDQRATVVIDELLKLYTQDELKDILNMTKEIDDDLEHLIEEDIER